MRPLTPTPTPPTTPNRHRSHVPSTGLGSITVFDPRLLAAVATAASVAADAASTPRQREGA